MKRFVLEMVACAATAAGIAFAQQAWGNEGALPPTAHSLDEWLINPYGQVDGALLHDGMAMFFSPAVGQMAVSRVRIGDPVRVETVESRPILVDERDGTRIDPSAPPRGGGPLEASPQLQPITARGAIRAFIVGSSGAISGMLLDTGEQVRIPAALSVGTSRLHVGDMVIARGHGTIGPWGTGMLAFRILDGRGRLIAGD